MKNSVGIIYFRYVNELEIFLAHSTGNYTWWSFPKGEQDEGETLFQTAIREFEEETSQHVASKNIEDYFYLGFTLQGSDKYNNEKMVHAFAIEADIDPSKCESNECEYPIGSGTMIKEIDDYKWFTFDEAMKNINQKQVQLLRNLYKNILNGYISI